MSTRYPHDHSQTHDSGSTRACDRVVEDFAFADTVVCPDLDEPRYFNHSDLDHSASGIVVSDEHQVMSLSYPLPDEASEASYAIVNGMPLMNVPMPMAAPAPATHLTWVDRLAAWMARSREEITLLWNATGSLEHVHDGAGAVVYDEDPLRRAATVGRRVRTLWSFFEWDRTDLVRAAWIGLLVFVLAATVGAFVLGSSASSGTPTFDNVSSASDLR
jgi:hypothetical protein